MYYRKVKWSARYASNETGFNLGKGEMPIVELTLNESNEEIWVCTDDLKARRVVQSLGITTYPSEFLLFEMLSQKIISLTEFQEILQKLAKYGNFSAERL